MTTSLTRVAAAALVAISMLAAALATPEAATAGDSGIEGSTVLRLELKTECRVSEKWITLGDIAEVSGAGSDELAEMRALRISHAPMPGVDRVLTETDIVRRLRVLGVEGEIAFTGDSGSVRIASAVRKVEGERLVKFGREFLTERLSRPGVEMTIEDPSPPQALILAADDSSDVEFRGSISGRRVAGLVPVAVEVWSGGKRQARRLLSFRVSAHAAVARAVRAIQPGTVLTAEDLEVSDCDLSLVPEDVIQERDALVGLRVLRPVSAGSMIRKKAVALAALVKRGEEVTLIARVGSVEARARARVKSDGAHGDVITVVNLDSNRQVRARVVGNNLVYAVRP